MNLHRKGNASSHAGHHTFADAQLLIRYDPPALSLDERGMILDCSKSFEQQFGFRRIDLVWKHVSRLLPQLKDVDLIQEGKINRLLNFLCHCGLLFQAQTPQGDYLTARLSIVHIETQGRRSLRLIVQPSNECRHDSFIDDALFSA
ncbi:MAG: PAS domain-containing protein [Sideroxydans sp.]|nr:PAS domain-containing protein [Sideroxydans sp.]